uniref:Uncharacterized protein n=1 Tax=Anopheles culicifacies TaxID=139723 RepID=A0A182MWF1_9DIPT
MPNGSSSNSFTLPGPPGVWGGCFGLARLPAATDVVPSSFERSSDSVRFASPPRAVATLRVACARSLGRSSSSESESDSAFFSLGFFDFGRGRSTFFASFNPLSSVFIMASSSFSRLRAADDFFPSSSLFSALRAGPAGGFGLSFPSPGAFESEEKPLQDSRSRMFCVLCNLHKQNASHNHAKERSD